MLHSLATVAEPAALGTKTCKATTRDIAGPVPVAAARDGDPFAIGGRAERMHFRDAGFGTAE